MELEHTFIIKTDDKDFKEAISIFLSTHCDRNNVNAAIYELEQDASERVMQIVRNK
ncbi:hypothetical protein [Viridibacillus arvi]|uniref:hypothetical protein n=1 Tax=Viridibacillus arvi TaxID=263475 RepID=UPI0034CE08A6